MKRIETLLKEAHVVLDQQYNWKPVNGVEILEIARAVDKINAAEKTLRQAFEVQA